MDEHPASLARDLDALGRRRVVLGAGGLAATTLLAAWACGPLGAAARPAALRTGSGPAGPCSESAEETEGPYPADGSNTANGSAANVLPVAGIVRGDLRASFGSHGGRAEGVPVTLQLKLLGVDGGCAELAGHAIYVWHCDRDGRYSIYDLPDQNYLRGVQPTDARGQAAFRTVFPGCYAGRMPHIHIEVYRNTGAATSWEHKLKTTQLAFPVEVCQAVYAGAPGYGASAANLAQMSFATDNVFADGTATEMSAVTGSVAEGYVVSLTVGIPV